jgi:hypothetical protein
VTTGEKPKGPRLRAFLSSGRARNRHRRARIARPVQASTRALAVQHGAVDRCSQRLPSWAFRRDWRPGAARRGHAVGAASSDVRAPPALRDARAGCGGASFGHADFDEWTQHLLPSPRASAGTAELASGKPRNARRADRGASLGWASIGRASHEIRRAGVAFVHLTWELSASGLAALLLQLSGEASTYSRSALDAKTTMTVPIADAIREFTDPSAAGRCTRPSPVQRADGSTSPPGCSSSPAVPSSRRLNSCASQPGSTISGGRRT